MSDVVIRDKKPEMLELDAGTYYWCKCGRSKTGNFCDGSHEGTDILPVEFKIEEKKEVALCQCKHTNTPPFCDGAHTKL